jgi:hypothetical protein
MSESLRREFADLRRFLTTRFFGAQAEPISEATASNYADHLRCGGPMGDRRAGSRQAGTGMPSRLPSCQSWHLLN